MNVTAPFLVVPLTSEHDRSQFNCGSEPLNVYFQNQVTQDIRRRVTACFIATAPDRRVAGYYTLASASLLLSDLPEPLRGLRSYIHSNGRLHLLLQRQLPNYVRRNEIGRAHV